MTYLHYYLILYYDDMRIYVADTNLFGTVDTIL